MKIVLTLFFLSALGTVTAEETENRIAPEFYQYKNEKASKLNADQAIYVFEIYYLQEAESNALIRYSIDNEEDTIRLKDGNFEVLTTPGKHIFQIYINENYEELYSDSLPISPQLKSFYRVRLSSARTPVLIDKPVIYLYPEKVQNFEVTVKPEGEFTFLYPEYNDAWKGQMSPDGKLEIEGQSYRYLFWESNQKREKLNPSTDQGFVVHSDEIMSFVENMLTDVGFNSQEKADFITYWVPRMLNYDQIFIKIDQDEACNQFAELNISPVPENVQRFYISWGEYHGEIIPELPKLSKINRNGFTVIEWGGSEIQVINENEI